MKNWIEVAKGVAEKAHRGQTEKNGKPYINHPLTVAGKVKTETEKIVALLHDVVEDSDITLEDIAKYGFSEEVVEAVDAITKKEGQTYGEYIEKVKTNIIAVKVKIADLTHNSDMSRIPNPTQEDIERTKKYLKVKEDLLEYIKQEELSKG